jgi:DNA-binding GntR family transcriptional regulator
VGHHQQIIVDAITRRDGEAAERAITQRLVQVAQVVGEELRL